jgi:hypothetical protein
MDQASRQAIATGGYKLGAPYMPVIITKQLDAGSLAF